jgi:hypothetical protein
MHPRMQELLDFMDEQYAAFRAAAEAVPAADRERQPEPGRWSVAQVVDHVARVEGVGAHRVREKLAEARTQGADEETETGPVISPALLAKLTDRSFRLQAPERAHPNPDARFDESWAALEAAHQQVRQTYADADGLALERLQMPHPALGMLDLYQWGVAMGGHEARHAAQIREIGDTLAAVPSAG